MVDNQLSKLFPPGDEHRPVRLHNLNPVVLVWVVTRCYHDATRADLLGAYGHDEPNPKKSSIEQRSVVSETSSTV